MKIKLLFGIMVISASSMYGMQQYQEELAYALDQGDYQNGQAIVAQLNELRKKEASSPKTRLKRLLSFSDSKELQSPLDFFYQQEGDAIIYTPLMKAVELGRSDFVQLFLQNGASTALQAGRFGCTPIEYVTRVIGNPAILVMVLRAQQSPSMIHE